MSEQSKKKNRFKDLSQKRLLTKVLKLKVIEGLDDIRPKIGVNKRDFDVPW